MRRARAPWRCRHPAPPLTLSVASSGTTPLSASSHSAAWNPVKPSALTFTTSRSGSNPPAEPPPPLSLPLLLPLLSLPLLLPLLSLPLLMPLLLLLLPPSVPHSKSSTPLTRLTPSRAARATASGPAHAPRPNAWARAASRDDSSR